MSEEEVGRLKLVSVDELPRMLKHTENAVDAKTLGQSKEIVDDVRRRGLKAVRVFLFFLLYVCDFKHTHTFTHR
jgi:hypothetical protein